MGKETLEESSEVREKNQLEKKATCPKILYFKKVKILVNLVGGVWLHCVN